MASTNSTTSVDSWYLYLDYLASQPAPSSRLIYFIILVIIFIPSILCSFYLFYQFIQHHDLLYRSTNMVVICLLIINFLQTTAELPMSLIFMKTKHAANNSYWFYVLWIILDQTLSSSGLWLMAFASIERYLFIFHSAILQRHGIILRYINIAWCLLEPFCFFAAITLFPPGCQNIFHPGLYLCSGACASLNEVWLSLSMELNICLPVLLIIFGNIVLFVRVFRQKRRMQQRHVWARNARMLLQLVSVAILYSICWLPNVIIIQIALYDKFNSENANYLLTNYFFYLKYISILLCPFVSIIGLPELHTQLRAIFCMKKNQIAANVIEMRPYETVHRGHREIHGTQQNERQV